MNQYLPGKLVWLVMLLFPVSAMTQAATTPYPLADTSWTLPGNARVSVQGFGGMGGEGNLRLTFYSDGDFYLEDDSGAGFWGTYAYDSKGKLSARVLPQSIEDFVYSALGTSAGFTLIVDSVSVKLQVSKGRSGPVMKVSLAFSSRLSYYDPNAGKRVTRKLTYKANASGPQD